MPAPQPSVVVIAGPTASGKSALALAAAAEFKAVIINADSQQCYRDLRILTARPNAADEARAPHRLFGYLSGSDTGSAAHWAQKAAVEIEVASATGKLPIVVGGTGFYLKALMEGLSEIPPIPAEARRDAKALFAEIGREAFHARLAARDPEVAARLNVSDTQRLLRAWEVVEATGTPLSVWQKAPAKPALAARYFSIGLLPPRADLVKACEARFVAMVEEGAVDEVKALLALGLPADAPVMKAVGVPELSAHVRGELPLVEAIRAAQIATRRYAKRQTTWFSNQFRAEFEINEQFSESLLQVIFPKIRHFLLTS